MEPEHLVRPRPDVRGDRLAAGVERLAPRHPISESDLEAAVELAGVHRRYHGPLARTVVLGTPSRELLLLEEAVGAGLQDILDVAAPGVPVRELSRTWNRTLAGYGLEKPSRLGYSIGVGFPPDWGERTISIRADDENVLAENMTFHLICGMWMTGYGYAASESIRITDTGVETFTQFPRLILRK